MNYSNIDSRIRTKVVLRPRARNNQPKGATSQILAEQPEATPKATQKKASSHRNQGLEK